MTTYVRSGHWRGGPGRVTHWVVEHTVSRDWWTAAEWEISRSPKLAAWVNPNATCPVCGQLVYFYQNRAGSRVYFDDLGKPWPKHPCTDNRDTTPYEVTSPSPLVRSPAETQAYKRVAGKAGISLPAAPDAIVLITVSTTRSGGVELLLAIPAGLSAQYEESYIIESASAEPRPRKGDVIFRNGSEISFFHRPTMQIVTFQTSRARRPI